MFLFVDESGRFDGRGPFQILLLRFTAKETLKRLQVVVRRTRRKFQRHLRRIGKLPPDGKLSHLHGGTKKGTPGIVQYPEECHSFFVKLAEIFDRGQNCQVYAISFRWNPAQHLPGTNMENWQPGKLPTGIAASAKRYSHLLGDLLSSIRPFPKYLAHAANRGDSKSREPAQAIEKRALLVFDQRYQEHLRSSSGRKFRSKTRKAFAQHCWIVLKRKKKLRGASLGVWFNNDEDDCCLQVVDVLSNFFFQSYRLGIEVVKAPTTAAVFRNSEPTPGITWEATAWQETFKVLEPSIECWKTKNWVFRSHRKLQTAGRRSAHRASRQRKPFTRDNS